MTNNFKKAFVILSLLICFPSFAWALDANEHDSFYLGLNLANVEVKDNPAILSGGNAIGGVKKGLFWILFAELG